MKHFIGTYECKADIKGRIMLPAPLKKQLSYSIKDGFVIKRAVFNPCLELYPLSEWDKLIEKITKTTDRKDLVNYIRALDRVLLHSFFVIPMYHIEIDRVAYWNKIVRPNKTPIYGYVLETWWERK